MNSARNKYKVISVKHVKKGIEITQISFKLSRKKAIEILMFLLSTSDRKKVPMLSNIHL